MIEFLSGRFRAVVVEVTTGVEVVLWRAVGTFGRSDDLVGCGNVSTQVFDKPIEVVCKHVERVLKTLG